MSVIIYANTHGGNGGPALNALATIILAVSFIVATAGFVGYRWMTRGERVEGREVLTTIAGVTRHITPAHATPAHDPATSRQRTRTPRHADA